MALATTLVALAGCADGNGDPTDPDGIDLKGDKGAITGLLVDDRFRPIQLIDSPQTEFQTTGFIVLQPTGETTQTTANGEFAFSDLSPGTYTVRVTAGGHEAVPTQVTVVAGAFSEISIVARRVDSEGSAIVTEEYSVFIPCGVDFVYSGFVEDCTMDRSGDSYRPGFVVDYTEYGANATWLISEMRANRVDRYEMQVREADGTGSGGARMAVAQFEGDYVKLQWARGETNVEWNGQNNNEPWNNEFPLHTILFRDSPPREELQSAGSPFCCGAGVYFGIKAQFVQSLFLGEHTGVDAYCVLC